MSYADRPWLPRYAEDQPHNIVPDFTDALSMFTGAVARNPDGDALRYFDGRITYRELDGLTDALAPGSESPPSSGCPTSTAGRR